MDPPAVGLSYILPIRSLTLVPRDELPEYLRWLAERAETIVVDGSPAAIFAAHTTAWADALHVGLRHVSPDADLATEMGKVGGVLTGMRQASHQRVIVADDDVRYDEVTLAQVAAALDFADVVRPQNYFDPLPWHACWDTGRILLNRVTGGDWPGTIAVRRSMLIATGGYDGRALFENLELYAPWWRPADGRCCWTMSSSRDDPRRRNTSRRNASARRTTNSRDPSGSHCS